MCVYPTDPKAPESSVIQKGEHFVIGCLTGLWKKTKQPKNFSAIPDASARQFTDNKGVNKKLVFSE